MIQLIILLCAVSLAPLPYSIYSHSNSSSAVLDVFVSFGTLTFFLLIISNIQRYYHTNKVFGLPNLSTTVLFSALSLLIIYALTLNLTDELSYTHFMRMSFLVRGLLILLTFLLITSVLWIDQEHFHVQRIQAYAIDKEREAIRIELNSLQEKLKPHFLFNSLNSISALTVADPKKAREMIHLLSDYMRKSVQDDPRKLIPLQEEIDHLQRYVAIEQIRFGDRLNVTYFIDEESLTMLVPALILQPIIENAIKYGLYGSLDAVEITVQIEKTIEVIHVRIQNPFDEDAQRASAGTGYGLTSIRKKLFLLFGQQQLLETHAANGQFTTHLTLPLP